jgi:predicted TIM-barrel fold metal-dependent hydrolase
VPTRVAEAQALPSEYFKEHAHWGFFEDHVGVRLRHEIGVDRMMWSTDFPHVVSRWPKSLQKLEQQMAGVPEEERRKMVAGNAIRFFGLDHKSAIKTQPGSTA